MPTKPLQTSSSHSWPVLPTSSWPQLGHFGDGPMAMDSGLPRSCLVSPYPITGDASAALTDREPRFDRRFALPPLDRRPDTTLCSGVARTTMPASAISAISPPIIASLPLAAKRTARYPIEMAMPTHTPRFSEYSSGAMAMTIVAPAIQRCRRVPPAHQPTSSHGTRMDRQFPQMLV